LGEGRHDTLRATQRYHAGFGEWWKNRDTNRRQTRRSGRYAPDVAGRSRFTLAPSTGDDRWNKARIVVQSLKTGERKILIEGGSAARYVPTGHIVYAPTRRLSIRLRRCVNISWQRADGTGVAEQLVKAEAGSIPVPEAWSPTGKHFLFTVGKGNGASLWTLSMQDKKSALFAESASRFLARAVFSPDGRWVAYSSSETGRGEIFVQPFHATGAKYQISKDGGRQPLWSPDGKELFYSPTLAGLGKLVSVKIATQPSFTFGNPTPISVDGIIPSAGGAVRDFDITPDGKYFIVVKAAGLAQSDSRTPLKIQVVLNWFRELQDRVPVK